MATVKHHFAKLISAVNPPKDRAKKARDIPVPVRQHLEDSDALQTVDPHTRLIGSYARSTAVLDIKDVDVLVFVDPEYEKGTPDVVLSDLFSALRSLPGAGDPDLRPQRRSIRVSYDDLELDIVPAVAPRGPERSLLIPDRKQREWIDSHPIGYADYLSGVNARFDERVKPMVKLVKYWRDHQFGTVVQKKPASYLVEVELVHVFEGISRIEGLGDDELFTRLLRQMYGDFSPPAQIGGVPTIEDPMLGHDIADDVDWQPAEVQAFVRVLAHSIELAEQALEEDDQEKCIAFWEQVLGDLFTEALAKSAGEMAAQSDAGRLGVTSTGAIRRDDRGADTGRVPKHRFHGTRQE